MPKTYHVDQDILMKVLNDQHIDAYEGMDSPDEFDEDDDEFYRKAA